MQIGTDKLLTFPGKTNKQAGAELCQAQEKLGLAKPAVPIKKLCRLPLKKILRSSSINQTLKVVLHLPKH